MNSQQNKKAACPTLLKFWKLWIDNDMEKRHEFSVKISNINATSEFKRKMRPRYIRCQDTIKSEIDATQTDSAYFKSRYSPDTDVLAELKHAVSVIEEIKAKKTNDRPLNVFQAVGVANPLEAKPAAGKKGKAK